MLRCPTATAEVSKLGAIYRATPRTGVRRCRPAPTPGSSGRAATTTSSCTTWHGRASITETVRGADPGGPRRMLRRRAGHGVNLGGGETHAAPRAVDPLDDWFSAPQDITEGQMSDRAAIVIGASLPSIGLPDRSPQKSPRHCLV